MKRTVTAPTAGLVFCALITTVVLTATPARAEPSIWAKARNPRLRQQAQTLEAVDALLLEAAQFTVIEGLVAPRLLFIRRAHRHLRDIGAATASNPLLRYRLARILYELYELEDDPKHLEQAVKLLRYVGQRAKAISHRADAYHQLGVCLARLGKHRDEIIAHTEALALEPHTETRALLLANRGEAFMAIGDLSSAIADYRASLAATPSHALHRYGVTTWWGLAVALDRSGDLVGGLEQIQHARGYDPRDRRLKSSGWFFIPAYDAAWYAALGHWHKARSVEDRSARLDAYQSAIRSWEQYLDRAPASDHWIKLASMRHRQCEREYRKLLSRPPL